MNIIIIKGKIYLLLLIIDWIVNHFGKNPMKGGIPAKDRKLIIKKILIFGLKFSFWTNWLIKKILFILIIIVILIVINI